MRFYAVGNAPDLFLSADIPGVDAQFVRAVLHSKNGELSREMHVRHDRNVHPRGDFLQSARVALVRNGDARDVASRLFQGKNLSDACIHVARFFGCHTLYGDLSAAQQNVSDSYLTDHLSLVSSFFFSIIF